MPPLPPSLLRWTAAQTTDATLEGVAYDPDRGWTLAENAITGTITSAPWAVRWQEAIPSWSADTPSETSIGIWLRGEIDGRWTTWYHLGRWSFDPSQRGSVEGEADADGEVLTDTLVLHRPASAIQWRVALHGIGPTSPALREFAVSLSPGEASSDDAAMIGAVDPLPVPELSQMAYADGGDAWCSPTSLAMVLAYWHERTGWPQLARFPDPQSVPSLVVPGVFDPVYDGAGNWSFNVAYAASWGLRAYVARLRGPGDLAAWLRAGVPLIGSVAWREGELDNAPIARSAGHLTVVVGLTADGDVIVNEPRCEVQPGASIRRVYRRDQFLRAWEHSGRAVYLVYPPEIEVVADGLGL
jgi:hypothetical protein